MQVVIIDDHTIIIDGLEMLLSFDKNITVAKTYLDGNLFLQHLREGKIVPDVVLIDLMMPLISGYELAKILKTEFPKIKIIILSMNCEAPTVYELIERVGVEGYLSKNVSSKELCSAIRDIHLGYFHISSEASQALTEHRTKMHLHGTVKLSHREKDVVREMINGLTNKEISEKLFISESTVETHRKNIYRKTDTHSLAKLISLVNELNLLEQYR